MGNHDVRVFRATWDDDYTWHASCSICWPVGGGRVSKGWRGVLRWATSHAREHEANRCEHCGRTS